MIALMGHIQTEGYGLILTSHDIPRGVEIAAEKIAYLERTKALAASSNDAEAFMAAMNAAFPNYYGEDFLGMTAEALFAD
jgi:hypothetical protein